MPEVVVLGLGVSHFADGLTAGWEGGLGGEVVEEDGEGLVFFVGLGEDEGGGWGGVWCWGVCVA